MNFRRNDLQPLVIDHSHVTSALHSIVHVILINRALGPIRTRDICCPNLDMQYAAIDDAALSQFIGRKINESIQHLNSFGSGTLLLSFHERRSRKTLFFTTKEEKVVWEQWALPVRLRDWIPKGLPTQQVENTSPCPMLKLEIEQLLQDRIIQILHILDEDQNHLPASPGPGQPPFYPFEVETIPCSTQEFWTLSLKRILRNGPPKFT